jgi:hypothetical protein
LKSRSLMTHVSTTTKGLKISQFHTSSQCFDTTHTSGRSRLSTLTHSASGVLVSSASKLGRAASCFASAAEQRQEWQRRQKQAQAGAFFHAVKFL